MGKVNNAFTAKQPEPEFKESPPPPTAESELMEIECFTDNSQAGLNLPEELYCKIFQDLSAVQYLLNCRLVCKNWKSAIDNFPKLIRRITFTIDNYSSFINSTISDKARSVRFTKPLFHLPEEYANILMFCEDIGRSVQKIVLDFNNSLNSQDLSNCAILTNSLLTKCVWLKELHILTMHETFWEKLILTNKTAEAAVLGNVQVLVLHANISEPNFDKLISHCKNLIKIEFKDGEVENGQVLLTLCQYIERNGRKLKEIVIDTSCRYPIHHSWYRFLFTCANHGVHYNGMDLGFFLDIKSFLTFQETSAAPINTNTCQYFKTGLLVIEEGTDRIPTNRIGLCRNITTFDIHFKRPAALEELTFLRELPKLENLYLTNALAGNNDIDEEIDVPVFPGAGVGAAGLIEQELCPVRTFEWGFPALRFLSIQGDVFGESKDVFTLLHVYFPGLKTLSVLDGSTFLRLASD